MPFSAWVLFLAMTAYTILLRRKIENLNRRITMNLNDLLSALQARAAAETDLKNSVITALTGLHTIVTQLRDEIAQQGLSSDSVAKFQAVLDQLDANKSAIADAVVANTDQPAPEAPPSGETPSEPPVEEPPPSDEPPAEEPAPATPDDTPDQPTGDEAAPAPDEAPADATAPEETPVDG